MNPLFKPFKNPLLIVLLAISIMMTLTACDQDRLAGCEGDIVVENEIPDLVMHLGDEPFRRDLVYEEPVVFRHTTGYLTVFTPSIVHGHLYVAVNIVENLDKGHNSILTVTPRQVGETIIEVIATDDCFDRRRTTTFKVIVLDAEEENNNKTISQIF
jgi:hypothetical protein